jgi:flagellar protein FlaG
MATVTPSPSAVSVERTAGDAQPAHAAPPAPQSVVRASAHALIDAMKVAAEQIQSYLQSVGRELQFSVDESTGRTVVTVRDSNTGEIVRQIPDAEALRLAQSLGSQPNVLIDISI